MKFDFCIGNPPYQGDNHQQLYPDFYLAGQQISNCVDMIFPVGWQEPKSARNLGKLNTKEIKADQQIVRIDNQHNVFSGISGAEWTNIILWKRGYNNGLDGKQIIYTDGASPEVKELLWDRHQVEKNISYDELKMIIARFSKDAKLNFSSIVKSGRSDLKFTDDFLNAYPQSKDDRLKAIQAKQPNTQELSYGEEYELKSSTFDVLPYAFYEMIPENEFEDDYYKLYGLFGRKRTCRYIRKNYMTPRYSNNNLNGYKVLMAEAASAGDFGATTSETIVVGPNVSCTPTFIGIGNFNTEEEANNCVKYIKTKFFRTLLGVLKTTRHNSAPVFAYIPLQDFTSNSDIDWSVPISAIDQQLYKKYGLSQEEIDFIETHVKEMKDDE